MDRNISGFLNDTAHDLPKFLGRNLLSVDPSGSEYSVGIRIFLIADVAFSVPWAVIANTIVIVSFFRDPVLRIIPNYYIINLACADWLMGAFVMPIGLYNIFQKGAWNHTNRALCKFWVFMDYTNCLQSSLAVVLISYDRYRMVCNPIEYRNKETPRKALLRIIASWIFSLIFYGCTTVFWDHFQGYSLNSDEECLPEFAKVYWATYPQAVVEFFIPLIVIVYCNIRLLVYVQERKSKLVRRNTAKRALHTKKSPEAGVEMDGKLDEKKAAAVDFVKDRREARNLLLLVGVYICLWFPYELVGNLLDPLCRCISFEAQAAASWPQYHLGVANPVLYAITIQRFRYHFANAFRSIFHCSGCNHRTEKSGNAREMFSLREEAKK